MVDNFDKNVNDSGKIKQKFKEFDESLENPGKRANRRNRAKIPEGAETLEVFDEFLKDFGEIIDS